ncbi:MAG: glucans biosynthesis glucosyltransferase MdoH [Gammaproteobacteria bacterium]|nr:glucans biosynthesis glucosyltransferase MdoH [Gammaproteobacteria bacterium]
MRIRPDEIQIIAGDRRLVLAILVLFPTLIGTWTLSQTLPFGGRHLLEMLLLGLFAILFAWLWIGLWTALIGFWLTLTGRDWLKISTLNARPDGKPTPLASTAVVMPICNEDADEVFARIRATFLSLKATGQLEHFRFYILSDSSQPEKWVDEELAWARLCREVDGFERIFYRRRKYRVKKKSGNIIDFLRRWGKQHEYMIVLDADSVMSGDTLVRLVQAMERNLHVGIIQTLPFAQGMETLYARIQQFAGRLYSPIFAAGLAWWWLGNGQYWGHNVIIRIAPFMSHCNLPRMPGIKPFGGEILSHDFVEAALMNRAGFDVWVAYDLGGSWEEYPPSLTDDLKRDRRWCQGNLQHAGVMIAEGLPPMQRFLLINGIMSYAGSLLWLALLLATTLLAWLTPEHAQVDVEKALKLFYVTLGLLFLPKIISLAMTLVNKQRAEQFGGRLGVSVSVLLETLLSALFAPVRMVFHSRFIILTLMNKTVAWGTQQRGEFVMSWREAASNYGTTTLLGLVWGMAAWYASPVFFAWLSPVLAGLVLSIPLARLTSLGSLGRWARTAHLFITPEEVNAPPELAEYRKGLALYQAERKKLGDVDGFVLAVVEPIANAIHAAFLKPRRNLPESVRLRRAWMMDKALHEGPAQLSPAERAELLNDLDAMHTLHLRVWSLPDVAFKKYWPVPGLNA